MQGEARHSIAEGLNVEIAHTLHDQSMDAKERPRPFDVLEFVEGILLRW
jgi:hypothetical protein